MSGEVTREEVRAWIEAYVRETEKSCSTRWRRPLAGFADAHHPGFEKLRELIVPNHVMPWEVLPEAKTVLVYFLPFVKEMADTNAGGSTPSPEWALAYEETNALFVRLNEYLTDKFWQRGVRALVSPEATAFNREILRSRWSQRHIAYLAGLGTFGLNNMLITKSGCCGRLSSLVTDLDVEPDQPLAVENCIYKRTGKCGVCVRHCPSGALTFEGYDRHKCFGVCLDNAKLYHDFGNSYASVASGDIEDTGSEVCGKCVVNIPCAFLDNNLD